MVADRSRQLVDGRRIAGQYRNAGTADLRAGEAPRSINTVLGVDPDDDEAVVASGCKSCLLQSCCYDGQGRSADLTAGEISRQQQGRPIADRLAQADVSAIE